MAFDHHALYTAWLLGLWHGDEAVADVLIAEDFAGHWPDRSVAGRAELVAVIRETRGMFSELSFQIELGPLCDGDMVAARWSGEGVDATGDAVRFLGHDLLRVEDGVIAEFWALSWMGEG